jgi:protein TonB
MKNRRIWAALAVAIVFALPAAAQDASSRAKDAEKAFKEAEKRAKKDTYRDAVAKYREAALAYKDAGDATGRVKSLVGAGKMLEYFGEQPAEAAASFAEAVEVARATADRALLAYALDYFALGRKALKDTEGAVRAYEECFAIYDALGDHPAAAAALSNISVTYAAAGDEPMAAETRARAMAYRKQYNVPPSIQRVSGGVLAGRALHRAQPPYPLEARQLNVEGEVIVEVTVSAEGKVESARAISGPPELRDAAVEAARQWTFTPTTLNGEPVRIVGTIKFAFRRS